jgi:hypothetical protein
MQIQIAKSRQIEHPLGNNAPVGDDENRIRLDRLQLRAEVGVGLNLLRLRDADPGFQRKAIFSVGTAKAGVPQKTSFISTRRFFAVCESCAE